MRILLDENFPLPLLRKLRDHGYDAEHIVMLAQRGLPDVSRVRQDTPIARRVEIWLAALERFVETRPEGDVFELLDSGEIVPWLVVSD